MPQLPLLLRRPPETTEKTPLDSTPNPVMEFLRGLVAGPDWNAPAERGARDWGALGGAALSLPALAKVLYHGSRFKFPATAKNPLGEFDLKKIGTGEGAQTYGHGMYLAESPKVARNYAPRPTVESIYPPTPSGIDDDYWKQALSNLYWNDTMGKPLARSYVDMAAYARGKASGDSTFATISAKLPEEFRKMYQYNHPEAQQARAAFRRAVETKAKMEERDVPRGYVYTVDAPDEIVNKTLPLDEPLPPELLQNMARKSKMIDRAVSSTGTHLTGAEIQDLIYLEAANRDRTHPATMSRLLRLLGIPGVRYKDAMSRGSIGEGTNNYVFFDTKPLKIIDRKVRK